MPPQEVWSLAVQIVGPLLGAGAGSYFGLKSALNGIRSTTDRTERKVDTIHDTTREIKYRLEREP